MPDPARLDELVHSFVSQLRQSPDPRADQLLTSLILGMTPTHAARPMPMLLTNGHAEATTSEAPKRRGRPPGSTNANKSKAGKRTRSSPEQLGEIKAKLLTFIVDNAASGVQKSQALDHFGIKEGQWNSAIAELRDVDKAIRSEGNKRSTRYYPIDHKPAESNGTPKKAKKSGGGNGGGGKSTAKPAKKAKSKKAGKAKETAPANQTKLALTPGDQGKVKAPSKRKGKAGPSMANVERLEAEMLARMKPSTEQPSAN